MYERRNNELISLKQFHDDELHLYFALLCKFF